MKNKIIFIVMLSIEFTNNKYKWNLTYFLDFQGKTGKLYARIYERAMSKRLRSGQWATD